MHMTEKLLSTIIGKETDAEFGQPFIEAFTLFWGDKSTRERITATGVTCSLFLSCLKLKFSSGQLNTFVRNIREEAPFIIFDCRNYEELYKAMERHTHILLLDKDNGYCKIEVSKEDIFETFDFITNN